ncbi:MAG: 50S ribosomal protein L32 [Chloroflexi bacterium]|nr:50S ribosomal protein L32 [Chloroflexota bacterium]
MPPLPKRKTSKARQGERRSHLAMKPRQTVECQQCHQPKLPHIVCPTCGTYGGREVIAVSEKKPR